MPFFKEPTDTYTHSSVMRSNAKRARAVEYLGAFSIGAACVGALSAIIQDIQAGTTEIIDPIIDLGWDNPLTLLTTPLGFAVATAIAGLGILQYGRRKSHEYKPYWDTELRGNDRF